MNLLLLEEADFIAADRAILRDRRLTHMQEVHRAEVGDSMRVGRIGGLMGSAEVLRLDADEAELRVTLDQATYTRLRKRLTGDLSTAIVGLSSRRARGDGATATGADHPAFGSDRVTTYTRNVPSLLHGVARTNE